MAEDFAHLAEQGKQFAEHMSEAGKSATSIGGVFRSFALYTAGLEIAKKAITEMVHRTATWNSLQSAMNRDNLDHVKLRVREMALNHEITRKTYEGGQQRLLLLTEEEQLEHKSLDSQLKQVGAQQNFARVIEETGKLRIALATTALGLTGDILYKSHQFNQNLIEANAHTSNRLGLLYRTLMTQAELGTSFGEATEAARALVHYGMDTEVSYKDNLKLVVQMHQGLDVSVQSAAKLATVVERQVKGSFTAVADVIAQLVDDTALAGEEAVKLATSITQAMGRLKPGLGAAGLPEVIKLVGRYESALKEVGGNSGAFEQLLTQMTTSQGLTGAGALGVSPDFLATADGVQSVMERFGQYGQMLVGQSRGWERQMRLEALGQQFNVSAEHANQMLLAIERANKQQIGTIDIQERWKRQMASLDQGVSRLTNSFIALAEGGLYPIIYAITGIVNKIADGASWLLKHEEVAVGAMVALGVGLVGTVFSMYRLARSLLYVVTTSNMASAAIARYNAAQTVLTGQGAFGFGGGFSGMFSWVPRLLGGITLMGIGIGLVVAAIGGLAAIAWKIHAINKKSAEESEAARKVIFDKTLQLESNQAGAIYRQARFGTPEGLQEAVRTLFVGTKPHYDEAKAHMSPADALADTMKWKAEKEELISQLVAQGTFTRGMFTPLSQQDPKEKKSDEEMLEITRQQKAISQRYLDVTLKQYDEDSQTKKSAEVEDAKVSAERITDRRNRIGPRPTLLRD